MFRFRSAVVLLLMLVLAGSGCSQRESTPPEAGAGSPETPGAPSQTADTLAPSQEPHSAGIVPGSWEDWCEEHAVPETECTRCDPSLIAAFKATGDWCQDHGLPMSQCRACDPTLVIARAPKPETP